MKSFLSLAFVVLVFLTVVVGAGLLWYLSSTSEFSRKDSHPATPPNNQSNTPTAATPPPP